MMESSVKDDRFKKNSDDFMEKEQQTISQHDIDIDRRGSISSGGDVGEGGDSSSNSNRNNGNKTS